MELPRYASVITPIIDSPVLKNTATAHYHPVGLPNDITRSSTWTTDLLHPSFTVAKVCKANTEPIPQAGPAVFTISFNNTGDADLHVAPSEGAAFDVAAGGNYGYDYSVDGPFSATVNSTVTGTVTLAPRYGLSNSYDFSASGSCVESLGDCDLKGRLDLADFASLAGCMAGPGSDVATECGCADMDFDGDVDLRDFAAFQIGLGAP